VRFAADGTVLLTRSDCGGPGGVLTTRELDMLRLMAEGRKASEIAAAVGLTVQAFRNVRLALFAKLGARSGPHAAAIGFRRGILRLDRRKST
jgi:DNA-binding CsgD family transcriptional regulator